MPAARPTEAALARAIRAAKKEGCTVVEVRDGAIRILVSEHPAAITSPEESEGSGWDEATGTGT